MISAIARHVAFFIYPHFNLIDLSGPLDAFAVAADMAPDSYRFTIESLEGGEIESWSGGKVTSEVALIFAREHLSEPLSVERLAEVAHLSVRQFSRAFVAGTGMTPAKAVERLRVEAARPRVEDGRETLDVIAQAVGFTDSERMRQSFTRILGHPPRALRRTAKKVGSLD